MEWYKKRMQNIHRIFYLRYPKSKFGPSWSYMVNNHIYHSCCCWWQFSIKRKVNILLRTRSSMYGKNWFWLNLQVQFLVHIYGRSSLIFGFTQDTQIFYKYYILITQCIFVNFYQRDEQFNMRTNLNNHIKNLKKIYMVS